MPQGKGTYGSKVGRPPKKQKKYQAGGNVGQNEAVLDAAMKGQELKSISLENIPTQNAPDRMETSPAGNEVGTGMYKEGGPVKRKDVPHLKSDNPKVQKMLDEGRERYVKKQNVLDEYERMRPKKRKGLAAPPKSKKPKKTKKSMGQA